MRPNGKGGTQTAPSPKYRTRTAHLGCGQTKGRGHLLNFHFHDLVSPNANRPKVNYLALGRRKVCEPYLAKLKAIEGMQMRTCIGIVVIVVVAIGLIWSVAVMSGVVPG